MSNILVLSRWFPFPPDNGSKLRICSLLNALNGQHRVSLLSFTDRGLVPSTAEWQSLCRNVRTVPWKPFNPRSWRARSGFLSRTPRSILDTFSLEMKKQIEWTLSKENPDLVIASELDTAVYSPSFRGLPAVFEDLELGVI